MLLKEMVVERRGEFECRVRIDRGTLEAVREFLYLGMTMQKNGECRKVVKNCVMQGRQVEDSINVLVREKDLIKHGCCECIVQGGVWELPDLK